MANSKGYGVRGIQRIATAPIAAGASFAQHDFIYEVNGAAVGPPTPGTNYTKANKILGRAINGTASDPGAFNTIAPTSVQYIAAETGTEFEVPLYHTTPALAVPTAANKDQSFELRNSTLGFAQVDLTATTNAQVKIVEPDPKDCASWDVGSYAAAVPFASVWVSFQTAQSALAPAA